MDDIDRWIADQVAAAPSLTPAQFDRLKALLTPLGGHDDGGHADGGHVGRAEGPAQPR